MLTLVATTTTRLNQAPHHSWINHPTTLRQWPQVISKVFLLLRGGQSRNPSRFQLKSTLHSSLTSACPSTNLLISSCHPRRCQPSMAQFIYRTKSPLTCLKQCSRNSATSRFPMRPLSNCWSRHPPLPAQMVLGLCAMVTSQLKPQRHSRSGLFEAQFG